MCRSNFVEITALQSFTPNEAASKDKSFPVWEDVQDWRNAVNFDIDLGCDDLLALDAPEFSQVDFDPYAPEVNSPTSATPCTEHHTETETDVAQPAGNPWDCHSDTEDAAIASTDASDDFAGPLSRVPKWKRRNAAKHLEGERNRRLKKKANLLALKPFLPKFKGKITTNDLLMATLAKVKELRAKEASADSKKIDFRAALHSTRTVASVAVDASNCVIEASESFLEFIQWPQDVPLAGAHISRFMHHHDAFQLELAISQDRRLTLNKPIASQIVGLARFVCGGDAPIFTFNPVEMDVSVTERTTVLSFALN